MTDLVPRTPEPHRRLASLARPDVWFLLGLFGFTVCRAATVSMTYDEADTWVQFVHAPVGKLFEYSTNNHVLNSWLMKVTVALFGPSELAARLPALLGAALYFGSIGGIAARLFPRLLHRLLAIALCGLHPLVLDLLCLARGYGLALGFFALALFFLTRSLAGGERSWRWPWPALASCSLALGCCANWSYVPICGALAVVYLLLATILMRREGGGLFWRWLQLTIALALPGLILFAAIFRPYAKQMREHLGNWGFPKFAVDSLRDLLNATFFRTETATRMESQVYRDVPVLADHPVQAWTMRVGAPILFGGVLLFLLLVLVFSRWLLARGGMEAVRGRLAVLLAGTLSFVIAAFYGLHRWEGQPYPIDRFITYMVPMLALLTTTVVFGFGPRWARGALVVAGAATVVLSLRGMDLSHTRTWMFNGSGREYFEAIEREHAQHPGRRIRATGNWIFGKPFEYYRVSRHADWMIPFGGPIEGATFVVYPVDAEPDRPGFRIVAEDPDARTRLAERVE